MLSTNDIRVLRALRGGPLSRHGLEGVLRATRGGAEPALRRLPSLSRRKLIHLDEVIVTITHQGMRELHAADMAAYGAHA